MGKTTLKSTGGTSKGAAATLAALIFALASCGSAPRETFDLSGASKVAGGRLSERGGTVEVAEPVALQPVASDRLVIRGASGDLAVLADAQWADRLPRLVEARLITRLRAGGVDATFPGAVASYRLTSELRRFEIELRPGKSRSSKSPRVFPAKAMARDAARRCSSERRPRPIRSAPTRSARSTRLWTRLPPGSSPGRAPEFDG